MKTIAFLIHPGEHLADELEAMGRTQKQFADMIGKTPQEVSHLITGKRNLNADRAMRLSALFGTTAQYWINLQNQYDIQLLAEKEETKATYDLIRQKAEMLTPAFA